MRTYKKNKLTLRSSRGRSNCSRLRWRISWIFYEVVERTIHYTTDYGNYLFIAIIIAPPKSLKQDEEYSLKTYLLFSEISELSTVMHGVS